MAELVGWIRIHRQIKEHWLWQDPVKLRWWLDILISVNHAPKKVNIGNELIDCLRGQSVKSLKTWADEWKTSKDTARNFLKLLEKDNMITLENLTVSTRLTVCKYGDYQADLHDEQTQSERVPNASQTRAYPNNNDNNVKNDNKVKRGRKPALVVSAETTLFNMVKTYWLEEFHPGWHFDGAKGKALKSLIAKIKKLLTDRNLKAEKPDPTDHDVVELFKAFCQNLPEYYKTKDLLFINSKYNEIIEELKITKNGTKQSAPRQSAYDSASAYWS